MSQVWCINCNKFIDLEAGRCPLCGKLIRGFRPVPTEDSSVQRSIIDHEETLVTADVVEILELGTSTVTTMAKDGKIPAVLSGGIWVFNRDVLDKWDEMGRPTEREATLLYAEARDVG